MMVNNFLINHRFPPGHFKKELPFSIIIVSSTLISYAFSIFYHISLTHVYHEIIKDKLF